MNDNIFRIELPKSTFSTQIWLRLVEYLILRILAINFLRTYCGTFYKIKKKMFGTYLTSFRTPTPFYFLNKLFLFCYHIAKIAEHWANIWEIYFWKLIVFGMRSNPVPIFTQPTNLVNKSPEWSISRLSDVKRDFQGTWKTHKVFFKCLQLWAINYGP